MPARRPTSARKRNTTAAPPNSRTPKPSYSRRRRAYRVRRRAHSTPSKTPGNESNEETSLKKPYEFRGHAYRTLAEAEEWTRQRHEPALEPALAIVDPHHHVWDDQRGRYLTHELAADVGSGHNVIATVFVEAGVMYRADGPIELKPVGEVEFVNGIAAMGASDNYGRARLCAGIVGHADLMLGDKVTPVLEAL